MGISVWQLVLILVVILIIFGAGKLPNVMKDIGKGVKTLKKELKEEDKEDEDSSSNS